jgi:hypothetical protein
MCLGDVLARMELFLFFSSILHVFHLELPKDQPLPSLRGNAGVTVTPDLYKVVTTIHLYIQNIFRNSLRSWIFSGFEGQTNCACGVNTLSIQLEMKNY